MSIIFIKLYYKTRKPLTLSSVNGKIYTKKAKNGEEK